MFGCFDELCVLCIYMMHAYTKVLDISNFKLPPKQKRGCPKGSELTVIGLAKKKHRDDGPVAFIRKHPKEKEVCYVHINHNNNIQQAPQVYPIFVTMACILNSFFCTPTVMLVVCLISQHS